MSTIKSSRPRASVHPSGFDAEHYQRDSLQAILGLFLQAQGHPLLQQSQAKSASAISRFLNVYPWSTRHLIRESRRMTIQQILSQQRVGRKPILQVIIDLTTLEKRGKFKALNGKRASVSWQAGITPSGHVFGRRALACTLEFSCLSR